VLATVEMVRNCGPYEFSFSLEILVRNGGPHGLSFSMEESDGRRPAAAAAPAWNTAAPCCSASRSEDHFTRTYEARLVSGKSGFPPVLFKCLINAARASAGVCAGSRIFL
jgi:hypothetical protein